MPSETITPQSTHFDTIREFMPGRYVSAESVASVYHRTTGRDYQPAGRDYTGRHRN